MLQQPNRKRGFLKIKMDLATCLSLSNCFNWRRRRHRRNLPGSFVSNPIVPRFMWEVAPSFHLLGVVKWEVFDTNLAEYAHVDLEAEEGKNGEDEGGEDYHIAEVLHRVNDGTHDRFEAGNHSHGLERPKYAKRSQGRKWAQVWKEKGEQWWVIFERFRNQRAN